MLSLFADESQDAQVQTNITLANTAIVSEADSLVHAACQVACRTLADTSAAVGLQIALDLDSAREGEDIETVDKLISAVRCRLLLSPLALEPCRAPTRDMVVRVIANLTKFAHASAMALLLLDDCLPKDLVVEGCLWQPEELACDSDVLDLISKNGWCAILSSLAKELGVDC
jgi:hypothetical protein